MSSTVVKSILGRFFWWNHVVTRIALASIRWSTVPVAVGAIALSSTTAVEFPVVGLLRSLDRLLLIDRVTVLLGPLGAVIALVAARRATVPIAARASALQVSAAIEVAIS